MKKVEMSQEDCEKFDKLITKAIIDDGGRLHPVGSMANLEEKLCYFREFDDAATIYNNEGAHKEYVIELEGITYIGKSFQYRKNGSYCEEKLTEVCIGVKNTIEEKISLLENEYSGLEVKMLAIESEISNLKWQNASRVISLID